MEDDEGILRYVILKVMVIRKVVVNYVSLAMKPRFYMWVYGLVSGVEYLDYVIQERFRVEIWASNYRSQSYNEFIGDCNDIRMGYFRP